MYRPSDGDEYIAYIQAASLEGSSVNLEKALNGYCKDEEWIFFKTNNRQHVVEFKGACPVNGQEKAKVNLQFIVEKDLSGYKVGAMLLDGEQQTSEQRDSFLQEVARKNEVAAP